MISFAFSGLSSSSRETGTWSSSHCSLEIFVLSFAFPGLSSSSRADKKPSPLHIVRPRSSWSALRSQACHHPHVKLEPDPLHVVRSRSSCSALRSQACRHPHVQMEPSPLHVVLSRSLLIRWHSQSCYLALNSSTVPTQRWDSRRIDTSRWRQGAVGDLAVENLAVKNFAVGTFGGQDFLRSGHFPVCIFFWSWWLDQQFLLVNVWSILRLNMLNFGLYFFIINIQYIFKIICIFLYIYCVI